MPRKPCNLRHLFASDDLNAFLDQLAAATQVPGAGGKLSALLEEVIRIGHLCDPAAPERAWLVRWEKQLPENPVPFENSMEMNQYFSCEFLDPCLRSKKSPHPFEVIRESAKPGSLPSQFRPFMNLVVFQGRNMDKFLNVIEGSLIHIKSSDTSVAASSIRVWPLSETVGSAKILHEIVNIQNKEELSFGPLHWIQRDKRRGPFEDAVPMFFDTRLGMESEGMMVAPLLPCPEALIERLKHAGL